MKSDNSLYDYFKVKENENGFEFIPTKYHSKYINKITFNYTKEVSGVFIFGIKEIKCIQESLDDSYIYCSLQNTYNGVKDIYNNFTKECEVLMNSIIYGFREFLIDLFDYRIVSNLRLFLIYNCNIRRLENVLGVENNTNNDYIYLKLDPDVGLILVFVDKISARNKKSKYNYNSDNMPHIYHSSTYNYKFTGVFDPTGSYNIGDIVIRNNITYMCISPYLSIKSDNNDISSTIYFFQCFKPISEISDRFNKKEGIETLME